MKRILILGTLLACLAGMSQQQPPIIDMHLHALPVDFNGPPPVSICAAPAELPVHDNGGPWAESFAKWLNEPSCESPLISPHTDEELRKQTLSMLAKYNIIGMTSGPMLESYMMEGGERILPGLSFNFWRADLTVEKVRELLSSGKYRVFGEVGIQYMGYSPSDPKFEPYAALAEELDIPVAIHVGTGPPGSPYLPGLNAYRARLHSPLEMEELLVRHPKLRIYLMHAGWPMLDDLLAVLYTHPQVYVDIGVICYVLPQKAFYTYLQRIVEAGFGKRVMFGSDQMTWPGAIEVGIKAIESADFLTETQKRDILYNNAARFLRLSKEEIARHHGTE